MADFLLEVGCEEVPARMIDSATAELAKRVGDLLVRERLAASPGVEPFSTPRRLAVIASGIAAAQADVEEQVLGPSLKVAYKDGAPTPAAQKFAEKVGLAVAQLEKVTTPKGEYVAATVRRKGRKAADILAEALPKEIAGLYWAKTMYWRGKSAERWVRPVHWMVALLGGEQVPVEWAGVKAGNTSRGHRLLASGPVRISGPAAYRQELASAKVLNYPERELQIRKALDAAARTIPGARWREDAPLLNKVVNLTEFPAVVLGSFDPDFLSLPEEVLVTVMRDHQNYFALEEPRGKLSPHFLAVLNREADSTGIIRHGHERVLRARFNDARFFWNADQRTPLRQRVDMLKSVTFQKELGSYFDKTQRVVALIEKAAELGKKGISLNVAAARDAALMAKTDLTTDLVKEFTELQGIVGGLYARAQGHEATVADAIYDQYKPQSMEDSAPRTVEGAVLSIADKADSIAGMFALGLQPTGSKDPFALRRQANGIVKTIAEQRLPISLRRLFAQAREGYKGTEAERNFSAAVDYSSAVEAFFHERLEFYLREVLNFAYDEVNAVLAVGYDDINDTVERCGAIHGFRNSERAADFESVCTAFKRIRNILEQARDKGIEVQYTVNEGLLKEPGEKHLWSATQERAAELVGWLQQKTYVNALQYLADLRPTLDEFFDHVLVMDKDENLRDNRLAMLHKLRMSFSIADFSEIVTEKK